MTEPSFTVYLVGAIALHLVPLVAIEPEPEPLELDVDVTGCHHACMECDDPEDDFRTTQAPDEGRIQVVDPHLTREQAIEMARSAGFLGSRPAPRVERRLSIDDEITLEVVENPASCCWHHDEVWRVKQVPLLPQLEGLSAPTFVDIGRPLVAGSLDRAAVRHHLKRHARELAACVAPGTRKEISLPFLITTSGAVTSAHSELPEPGRRCFEDVISRITFPPSNEHTQVWVPVVLVREPVRSGLRDNGVSVQK